MPTSKLIYLAVDIMGNETSPQNAIKACVDFVNKHDDLCINLIGTASELENLIETNQIKKIIATEIINQSDTVFSARKKTNSSMYVGLNLINQKKVMGCLSAGNSAVFVALAYNLIGLKTNITKPAFMPFIPTTTSNKFFNLLDVGANLEATADELVQFALMAVSFNQTVLKKLNPSVGILNIGTEINKGFLYHKQAYEILKENKKINFIGFVESKNLLNGICDIVVTDGYGGNLVLKAMEGTMLSLATVLKTNYKKPQNFLGYLFSKNVIKNLKQTFDYKNHAGAIVLGLNGLAVKTHGSSGYLEYTSALLLMYQAAKYGY